MDITRKPTVPPNPNRNNVNMPPAAAEQEEADAMFNSLVNHVGDPDAQMAILQREAELRGQL